MIYTCCVLHLYLTTCRYEISCLIGKYHTSHDRPCFGNVPTVPTFCIWSNDTSHDCHVGNLPTFSVFGAISSFLPSHCLFHNDQPVNLTSELHSRSMIFAVRHVYHSLSRLTKKPRHEESRHSASPYYFY
jgi:hypothetical protein